MACVYTDVTDIRPGLMTAFYTAKPALVVSRQHMVEQEDGEEFVLDIVNEIVESTMRVLHDKYIVSQTLPYTIQETKNLLLQIIEVKCTSCMHERKL